VCVRVVTMEYYSRNDVTLGGFLERYCFREAYRCSNRNCDIPMSNHVRRFVHGNGCLQIVMKRLDMVMPGTADTIYMWSFCKKCREVRSFLKLLLFLSALFFSGLPSTKMYLEHHTVFDVSGTVLHTDVAICSSPTMDTPTMDIDYIMET